MLYFLFFGFLSVTLTGVGYALLFDYTSWHPYLSWLVAVNGVTLVMYGIDRWMGSQDRVETPETVMHLLTAAGGFVGAWLGRAIFRYQVDAKAKPWVHILLIVSTLGHVVLVYSWLIKGL